MESLISSKLFAGGGDGAMFSSGQHVINFDQKKQNNRRGEGRGNKYQFIDGLIYFREPQPRFNRKGRGGSDHPPVDEGLGGDQGTPAPPLWCIYSRKKLS